MNSKDQDLVTANFHPTISSDRLNTYLIATNFSDQNALNLYIWNAYIGEAFHLPIQSVEIGLRNRINQALVNRYGDEWWREAKFLKIAHSRQQEDIQLATRRIQKRQSSLSTGQLVATLSFGFWSSMLDSRYNVDIWSTELKNAFPNLPAGKDRGFLSKRVRKINDLRNRIWHHEPIFRLNLSQEYADTLELLRWICQKKHDWIRPKCRVPIILRQKPKGSS
ncbi:Abi family protein [Hirschia litorea]|uniref:Abi family protein n=2 Tax=Hirschia litorea TaxID=1199156 RepID=A0ABW2IML7_9PROT